MTHPAGRAEYRATIVELMGSWRYPDDAFVDALAEFVADAVADAGAAERATYRDHLVGNLEFYGPGSDVRQYIEAKIEWLARRSAGESASWQPSDPVWPSSETTP